MSLRSTRKRLKEYFDLLRYQTSPKEKYDSFLSKFGVNPESIVKNKNVNDANKNSTKKEEDIKPSFMQNYIERTKMEKAKKDAYDIIIDKNQDSVKEKIKFSKVKENVNLIEKNNKEENHRPKKILLMAIVELVTLIIILAVGFVVRVSNTTQTVPFNTESVRSPDIDVHTLEKMKGYRTVAIFGLDSRSGSVGKGNNADVNIIANIDLETGAVQLVSIYRDLYLNLTDDNGYGKINGAYLHGGPERSVKAINKNLDLDITNYVSFNWKAVADGINMLGGVDLEINGSEFKFINSFIHETCIATGIDGDNPAANYLISSGYQHLNGVQAVAYARLRLMDSDFQRVERQKKVIALCLEKAKTLDVNTILGIAISIIPTVSYNFDWGELTSLVKSIDAIHIVESTSFPDGKHVVTMNMGGNGDCLVPNTLEQAVPILHKILYNDEEYTPSRAVKTYSARIAELRRKYEEENKIEASRKAEENSEENVAKGGVKVSSKSNAKRKGDATTPPIKPSPLNKSDNNKGPVVPIIGSEYDEEPEDDTSPISPTPRSDDSIVEPVPLQMQDQNAPYNSNNDNIVMPSAQDIPGAPGTSNTSGSPNSAAINNSGITPYSDEENLPSSVTAPPGVSSWENSQNTISVSPAAPPIQSTEVVTPPVSGQPDQSVNSGPPIG